MTQTRHPHRGYEAAAVCGMLAGPVLLVASVAATLAQPDEFSFIEHATSDLGADTANAPWISNQLTSNLPGLLVAVFSVGLWHMLGRHRPARIDAFLIGLVGVGLFLTGIFTVDCREIDVGCNSNDVSWQAGVHSNAGLVAVLALVVSPFVVARGARFADGWRDLRVPSLVFGCLTIIGAVAGSAVGEGFGQYVLVFVWFAWITVLAVRMRRLARASREPTATSGHRLDRS
jgi:hypothetical protein